MRELNRARFGELKRRLRDGEIDALELSELEAMIAEAKGVSGDAKGGLWMFLRWGEVRMSRVYPALLAGPESGNAFALMHACALSLSKDGQRVAVSMAEFGKRLGLSRPALSRAVATLEELEVLQFPVRLGKSRTFELDARLVTHMDEAARKVAAASQAARRELAKRAAEAEAKRAAEAEAEGAAHAEAERGAEAEAKRVAEAEAKRAARAAAVVGGNVVSLRPDEGPVLDPRQPEVV